VAVVPSGPIWTPPPTMRIKKKYAVSFGKFVLEQVRV
jgi:hypothetical protein